MVLLYQLGGYHLSLACNLRCSSGVRTLRFVGSLFCRSRSLWWIIKLVIGCFSPSPSEILPRRLMIASLCAGVSSDILITPSNVDYNTSYMNWQDMLIEFRNKLLVVREVF